MCLDLGTDGQYTVPIKQIVLLTDPHYSALDLGVFFFCLVEHWEHILRHYFLQYICMFSFISHSQDS